MRYRVSPHGVQAALSRTADAATELNETAARLEAAAVEAMGACAGAAVVTSALQSFASGQSASLDAAARRIGVGLDNAALAVAAYKTGDHDMMRTFQTNADRLVDPLAVRAAKPGGR